MESRLIIFSVVMALSAISFIASICVLIYYKRKNFELKGEVTISDLAKRFTTISLGINLSVLISFAASIISFILPPLAVMGIFISLILCGISIVIGPAVSLLGIVFSRIGERRGEDGKVPYVVISGLSIKVSYVVISGLSMLCSVYIMSLYVNLICGAV